MQKNLTLINNHNHDYIPGSSSGDIFQKTASDLLPLSIEFFPIQIPTLLTLKII